MTTAQVNVEYRRIRLFAQVRAISGRGSRWFPCVTANVRGGASDRRYRLSSAGGVSGRGSQASAMSWCIWLLPPWGIVASVLPS